MRHPLHLLITSILAVSALGCGSVPVFDDASRVLELAGLDCVPALATPESSGWCGVGHCKNLPPVCTDAPPAWQCDHIQGAITPCDSADCEWAPELVSAVSIHTCYDFAVVNCALTKATVTGELPPGLTFDGTRISGRPLLLGSWSLAVLLEGEGMVAEQTLRIDVIGDLHLSELMINPDAVTDAKGEWVEVYNPFPHAVHLADYHLLRSSQVINFPADAMISAHGTWVQGRSADGFNDAHGHFPDGVGLGGLVNGGDVLRLIGPQGEVDCLAWGDDADQCVHSPGNLGSANGFGRVPQAGCGPTQWLAFDEPGTPGCFSPYPLPTIDLEASCFPGDCVGCDPGCRCRFAPRVSICAPIDFFEVDEAVPFATCFDDGLDYSWTTDSPDVQFGTAITHAFTVPGRHDVTVTAHDDILTDVATRSVHVRSKATRPLSMNLPPRTYALDQDLADFLLSATSSVDAAFYDLDRPVVCEALAKLAHIGVQVRLVVDADAGVSSSCINALTASGGTVVIEPDNGRLMHHKFAVVDDARVWTGSYNPTDFGTFLNANNALVIDDEPTVAAFSAEFEQLAAGVFGNQKAMPMLEVPQPHSFSGVLFSPTHDVPAEIIARIAAAQHSVVFLAFSFTHTDIAQAMVDAHAGGLDVRGMIASFTVSNTGSVASLLSDAGIDVRKDTLSGFLHHKVIIIDAEDPALATLITGSFNFSFNAASSSDENVVFVFDPQRTAAYRDLFEILWDNDAAPLD